MSDDDVMISIHILVKRDGSVRVTTIKPNGAINAENIIVLGALQATKESIKFESKWVPDAKIEP